MEVDGGIPGVIGGLARRRIPLLKALQAGPGLQLRPIHREVFVREQAGCPGLSPDGIEECRSHIAGQQPVPVLGKRRRMPDRVVHIQPRRTTGTGGCS